MQWCNSIWLYGWHSDTVDVVEIIKHVDNQKFHQWETKSANKKGFGSPTQLVLRII